MLNKVIVSAVLSFFVATVSRSWADLDSGSDTQSLAQAAQNPVANMISLPLQNNTDFNYGPKDKTLNTLNIQPVLPFTLNEDWYLISRTIIPLINQEDIPVAGAGESGLGDLLQIGYQTRPDLFAKDIRLPEMLYSSVLEVDERVSANGDVLQPLNQPEIETSLRASYDRGINAVAIVLLHGYAPL